MILGDRRISDEILGREDDTTIQTFIATIDARQHQGGGSNGTANDIAVAWPPGRAPILVAVYFTGSTISDDARSAVIADAGRIAVAGL